MKNRRSVRKYTGEPLKESDLAKILQAGLLTPGGFHGKLFELIVVRDKEILKSLSNCRPNGAGILADASCAVVVIGNTRSMDNWVEYCSIAMFQMHLMADALGIGSCWVQGRLRMAPDGRRAEDIVRELLHFPDDFALEAILCLGMPDGHPEAYRLEELPIEKIHWDRFSS